jgi:hypothetical protein
MEDNSLLTYDYGKNLVTLLRWLKETPPNDIELPTAVNRNEICEGDVGNTVDVVKVEDLGLQCAPYSELSQG